MSINLLRSGIYQKNSEQVCPLFLSPTISFVDKSDQVNRLCVTFCATSVTNVVQEKTFRSPTKMKKVAFLSSKFFLNIGRLQKKFVQNSFFPQMTAVCAVFAAFEIDNSLTKLLVIFSPRLSLYLSLLLPQATRLWLAFRCDDTDNF